MALTRDTHDTPYHELGASKLLDILVNSKFKVTYKSLLVNTN
jgi:hypothetical protein